MVTLITSRTPSIFASCFVSVSMRARSGGVNTSSAKTATTVASSLPNSALTFS
ncbi:MAG: hypothetical protein U0842_14965 [Candidatus Binatia bacterium]